MSTLLLLLLTTLIPLTTSYAIIWQPQATITTLQATMVIPQVPAGPGIHFIWPGLQPSSNQYVFQDVSGDDTGIGAWTFADWAVNSVSNYNKSGDVAVYPDDSIAISFQLNTQTGEWSNEWVTSPGSAGSAAGEVYTISDSVVPDSVVSAFGALTQALFVIELQAGATWNFGPLIFKDIKIVAETSETIWCTTPSTADSFTFSMTDPIVGFEYDQRGNIVASCSIEGLVFLKPL